MPSGVSADHSPEYELVKALGYFENNAPRIRYKWFRSRGLFTVSGVVEAGCKTVIGQRLNLSGTKWTVVGPDAVYPRSAASRQAAPEPDLVLKLQPDRCRLTSRIR